MSRRLILVVDDHDDLRDVVCEMLEHLGFAAEGAPDGLAARARLEGPPPVDLVLCDLLMPRLGGHALVPWVIQTLGVPVILFSGELTIEATAARLGATGWLPKPPRPDALQASIVAALGR